MLVLLLLLFFVFFFPVRLLPASLTWSKSKQGRYHPLHPHLFELNFRGVMQKTVADLHPPGVPNIITGQTKKNTHTQAQAADNIQQNSMGEGR